MTEEIAGFQTSPKAQVQAAFEEIARRSMHDLSFLHPSMPVYVSDFTLFEGQWTGCVITPWMLSAVIFPGPDQLWPLRKVSEKIGLQLPYGTMTFTVGELDGVSQYLSCSLMSPLSHSMSIEEGQRLTDDCARMILSLPVTNPDVPHAGRRALLFGRRSGEMHELSLCQSAVEIIQRQAEQHDVKRVTAVWLEIGALSCVEESAVRFSFEIVCHGTVAQGCDLHIVYKPAQAWCWDCSLVVEIHQHDAQCPLCHGERLRVDTGDSLIVKSIEVE